MAVINFVLKFKYVNQMFFKINLIAIGSENI